MKILYFFRQFHTGVIYKTFAEDSDAALVKCLQETSWKLGGIVYEGKAVVPTAAHKLFSEFPDIPPRN